MTTEPDTGTTYYQAGARERARRTWGLAGTGEAGEMGATASTFSCAAAHVERLSRSKKSKSPAEINSSVEAPCKS